MRMKSLLCVTSLISEYRTFDIRHTFGFRYLISSLNLPGSFVFGCPRGPQEFRVFSEATSTITINR